jgi:hypothetical protein
MSLMTAHVAGFPIEEVLLSLSAVSTGVLAASLLRRAQLIRERLRGAAGKTHDHR